jgi:hypothetical protein
MKQYVQGDRRVPYSLAELVVTGALASVMVDPEGRLGGRRA